MAEKNISKASQKALNHMKPFGKYVLCAHIEECNRLPSGVYMVSSGIMYNYVLGKDVLELPLTLVVCQVISVSDRMMEEYGWMLYKFFIVPTGDAKSGLIINDYETKQDFFLVDPSFLQVEVEAENIPTS